LSNSKTSLENALDDAKEENTKSFMEGFSDATE